MASRANSVYRPDITYGNIPMRRGNWTDRLPGIDKDIAAMESKLQTPPASTEFAHNVERAIQAATGKPNRPSVHCAHTPPASFHPGQPLSLSLGVSAVAAHEEPTAVHLYYRHVNQAERWLSVEMQRDHNGYSATIPGEIHKFRLSVAVLLCAFSADADAAWLYPAFNATLSNQPYYAIAKRSGS